MLDNWRPYGCLPSCTENPVAVQLITDKQFTLGILTPKFDWQHGFYLPGLFRLEA